MCLNKIIDGHLDPKNMQTYVKSFVEELLELWTGIEMYDASRGKKVLVRVMLINCIQDGRATRALTCQKDAGCKEGCRSCDIVSSKFNNKKYIYFGHRAFLPIDHPLREDARWAEPDYTGRTIFGHPDLMDFLDSLEKGEKNVKFIHGVEGRPELLKLPYWDWARCHSHGAHAFVRQYWSQV